MFSANEIAKRVGAPRAGLIARYLTELQLNMQESDPGMTCLVGKRVVIETRPSMPCQTDGEWAGYTPLTCELIPRALRLLVPLCSPVAVQQTRHVSGRSSLTALAQPQRNFIAKFLTLDEAWEACPCLQCG